MEPGFLLYSQFCFGLKKIFQSFDYDLQRFAPHNRMDIIIPDDIGKMRFIGGTGELLNQTAENSLLLLL